MDDNCDRRFRLLEAWEKTFPNVMLDNNTVHHRLLDNIGQPSRGEMTALFLGVSLNLPRKDLDRLKESASETMRECLRKIDSLTESQAKSLQNVLDQKDDWISIMHSYVQKAGVFKETCEPLGAIISPQTVNKYSQQPHRPEGMV